MLTNAHGKCTGISCALRVHEIPMEVAMGIFEHGFFEGLFFHSFRHALHGYLHLAVNSRSVLCSAQAANLGRRWLLASSVLQFNALTDGGIILY